MKLHAIPALLLLSPWALAQEGKMKIATVDMQLLFKSYHRTGEINKDINTEQAKIQQQSNERRARIQELDAELQSADKQLRAPSVADSRKQVVARESFAKQNEVTALEDERRKFVEIRTQRLRESAIARTSAILQEIRKKVEERAMLNDFDCVFDESGLSTSQVPFLLYAKESHDLTSEILEELDKERPTRTPAAEGKEEEVKKTD